MTFESILFDVSGKVATITLNRPDKLNPIDLFMGNEINAALDAIDADKKIQIIVFRGAGRAFCAGGDIGEGHLSYHMLRTDGPSHPEEMEHMMKTFVRLFDRIEQSDKIVIGLVHGVCAGGGLEFVTCLDMIVASTKAKFTDAHLSVGQLPGAGGSQRLARMVGPIRAKEILLTGRFFSAQEAKEMGLATYCVEPDALEAKLTEVVDGLLAKSFTGRAAMKYFVNHGLQMPLGPAIEMERLFGQHYSTTHPDSLEGANAFWEKRPPQYVQPGE